MYGTRELGRSKFIAGVADKGIEYVKSILEEYHDDDELVEEESDKPKGYSPLHILYFCNKFNAKYVKLN